MRRTYSVRLTVNGRLINEIMIDPHYETKHRSSVNDEIIIELIRTHLDGGVFPVDGVGVQGHEYFSTEPLHYQGKPYRLVWLLPPTGHVLGVVNCFRRSHGKSRVSVSK